MIKKETVSNLSRRDFIKKTASAALVLAASTYFTGCGTDDADAFSGANFAVISDPHVYDTRLGTYGAAWQKYLLSDRKLLAESESILASAVDRILEAKPKVDFVIVAGDLTKDGEKQCHELFASYMNRLIENGIKVLVVPGNHDINNPHAMAFNAETPSPVPGVSPDEFKAIYNGMGFADAVLKDPASLSYIAEPVDDLWVFCLDSCKYESNYADDYPKTSGAFSDETLSWILENIDYAKHHGKKVMGVAHHGIVEHFTGQSQVPKLGDEYVVDNWKDVSEKLAKAGMGIVFTGHYHAQDITKRTMDDGSFIFDVETGSLVTFPNPVRFVSITNDFKEEINSEFVNEIDYNTNGMTFPEYAKDFLVTGLTVQAPYYMTTGFGISQEKAAEMTPDVVKAFTSHYAGDEKPTLEDLGKVQSYMSDSNPTIAMMGGLLGALWTDLPPSDNFLAVNLNTGEVID